MPNETLVNETPKTSQQDQQTNDQVEAVLTEILRDHPQLRLARELGRKEEEFTDQFAREFLKVFRQRLQG